MAHFLQGEVVKINICLLYILYSKGGFGGLVREINVEMVQKPVDCLKLLIPSLLYTLQNNLQLIAISNISAAVFQVKNLDCTRFIPPTAVARFFWLYSNEPKQALSSFKYKPNFEQVTAQLKILTTAVFSVLILGRALGMEKVRNFDQHAFDRGRGDRERRWSMEDPSNFAASDRSRPHARA